jgi:hypothetical protein
VLELRLQEGLSAQCHVLTLVRHWNQTTDSVSETTARTQKDLDTELLEGGGGEGGT